MSNTAPNWNNPPATPAPDREVQVERTTTAGSPMLRVFQVLVGLVGVVLFVAGLVAVFRVDFGAGWLAASGDVAGFGFSPALAIAAILLGALTMVAAFADQDRVGSAFLGFLTIAVGIAAIVLQDEVAEAAGSDRRSATLFVVLGVVIFVLSLVPWWSGRRSTTEARRY